MPIEDVADLSGVPEAQLARIIRLTATVGFLRESQPALVAHSALSAPFVTNPSYLDAAMFLAESAAPAALGMAATTQRFGESDRPNESAYNVALDTTKPFHNALQERTKLRRQWSAYLRYAGGLHAAEQVTDVLTQFDWANVSSGSSLVVEVLLRLLTYDNLLTRIAGGRPFNLGGPKPCSFVSSPPLLGANERSSGHPF